MSIIAFVISFDKSIEISAEALSERYLVCDPVAQGSRLQGRLEVYDLNLPIDGVFVKVLRWRDHDQLKSSDAVSFVGIDVVPAQQEHYHLELARRKRLLFEVFNTVVPYLNLKRDAMHDTFEGGSYAYIVVKKIGRKMDKLIASNRRLFTRDVLAPEGDL